ncbi:cysteine--tRNA ligase [Candidatus Saccharibacteria bacterium]|nr:cysteine--tRNA ligase [Candidatus Saccharibacteria bacterium]
MKLYNSLTKKVEELDFEQGQEVKIYSCGPTVYDHAHIGNLSSYIYADTLRRVLELNGYKVKHVMNYTDVDDKTIKRSLEKYPDLEPKEALKKLTDEYIALFQEDIKKVGIDVAKINFVRATDHIEDMKKLILKLLDKKIAYLADDGVYFSIEAYKKSGKTYGQLLKISDSNTSSARIDNDEYDKDSVHDFALWKKQKPGEPDWDFEINGQNFIGRPGWHIECSAMSEATLGIPFDIHTGGIDLIFPHHENEIAQSTAAIDGEVMARYFVHNNHLLVDGKKMAKSANNFYTLQDIIDKGYDPLAFRLLVLQSHYRKESNFTWDSLESAQDLLRKIRVFGTLRHNIDESKAFSMNLEVALNKIYDDLNFPAAMPSVKGFAASDSFRKEQINEFVKFMEDIFAIYIGALDINKVSNDIKDLVQKRETAKTSKRFNEADKIRDDLNSQGIGITDTDSGPTLYRL